MDTDTCHGGMNCASRPPALVCVPVSDHCDREGPETLTVRWSRLADSVQWEPVTVVGADAATTDATGRYSLQVPRSSRGEHPVAGRGAGLARVTTAIVVTGPAFTGDVSPGYGTVTVGSCGGSAAERAVPVDVITMPDCGGGSLRPGHPSIAPSFNFRDDDHRRHRYGAPGDASGPRPDQVSSSSTANGAAERAGPSEQQHRRGSTGVDLNAIPLSASDHRGPPEYHTQYGRCHAGSSTSCSRAACRGRRSPSFGLSGARSPATMPRLVCPAAPVGTSLCRRRTGGRWRFVGRGGRQGQRHDRR